MKILFVCLGNRFRSKIAESYFKKINKSIQASSAGIVYANPISKKTIKTVKGFGIDINKGNPKRLVENELYRTNKIIIVANNVPPSILKFFNKNVEVWKIPDCLDDDQEKVKRIVKAIIKKVEKLNKKLEEK